MPITSDTTRNPYIVLFGFVTVAGQISSADYNKIVDHGISISDANQCTDNGSYYIGIGSNTPSNYVILDVVNVGGRVIQRAYKIDDSTKRWIRTRESSTASFTGWALC